MASAPIVTRGATFARPVIRLGVQGHVTGRALAAVPFRPFVVARSYAKRAAAPALPSLQPPVGAPPLGHPWRLLSAVCLERIPLITPPKTAFDKEYEAFADLVRTEKSKLTVEEQDEFEKTGKVTIKRADVIRDPRHPLFDQSMIFQPASRTPDPAVEADLHNHTRTQAAFLYLVVKRDRNQHQWQMPQTARKENESMRQAAERGLREVCGEYVKAFFLSNAPSAFHSYKFPPDYKAADGTTGAKVFFFRAHFMPVVSKNVLVNPSVGTDFAWVSKAELPSYVSSEYYESIMPLLR